METLIEKINELEIKAKVYSDNYGPNSDEVKAVDQQIAKINLEILDIMCPEQWALFFLVLFSFVVYTCRGELTGERKLLF